MAELVQAPIDPAAVPQLNGVFAPVVEERDAAPADIEVVQGAVPRDLNGAYLRNGPNPRFTPLGSYTYPLDGDGMVHGLWFDDGAVRYRNRFVRTPSLEAEERAGRALWPGVMTWGPPGEDLVGPELAGADKDLPDINVVRHGGRLLALAEGARQFELTDELATVGPYDYGGALPSGFCAHPKVDPVTGEMVVFRYGFDDPRLTWSVVDRQGRVTRAEEPIEIDATYMIHDCVITEHHLVLFVAPCIFDLGALAHGGSILAWEPERGMRIAVVSRRDPGAGVRWFETDAFWVWHFANAYEEVDERGATTIVVDYPHWSHPGMGLSPAPPTAGVARARLSLGTGSVQIDQHDDAFGEFPRIDDRLVGRRHRYFHLAGKDGSVPTDVPGLWNRLSRYDTESGAVVSRPTGRTMLGEAVFAPRDGSRDESEGYVMTYATDADTLETSFLILHAADIAGEPAATLRLPFRVPFGLHGTWIPAGTP